MWCESTGSLVLRRAWTPLLYRLPHTEVLQLSMGSIGAFQLEFASGILCLSQARPPLLDPFRRHRYLGFFRSRKHPVLVVEMERG